MGAEGHGRTRSGAHGSDQSFHEVFNRADDNMYKRKEQLKSMGADARD